MSITVRNITKQFGTFRAVDNVSLEYRRRFAGRAAWAFGLGQNDAAANHRRPGDRRTPAPSSATAKMSRIARPRAQRRLRVSALRAVSPHDGVRKRGVRFASAQTPTMQKFKKRYANCLHLVRLERMEHRYPSQLSGGQRQRDRASASLGDRTEGAAARRTVWSARCQGAARTARLAATVARRDSHDERVGHARSRRSV